MEPTQESAIAKIIFWQKLTAFIFILFLLSSWGFALYTIKFNLELYYFEDIYKENVLYIAFCLLGTYVVYLLLKSLSFLIAYQKRKEELDLELAFQKQRHFWRVGPMVFMLTLLAFIAMIIPVLINLYR
jgi:hypothetical protein